MAKKSDTLNLIIDDISDEGVDFNDVKIKNNSKNSDDGVIKFIVDNIN